MKVIIFILVFILVLGCSDQKVDEEPVLTENTPISESKLNSQPESEPDSSENEDLLEVIKPADDVGLREDEISEVSDSNSESTEYKAIAWTDLMPKEDLDALLNPPSYITDAKEGSLEDQINSGLKSAMAAKIDDPYQRALASKNVVAEYDGMAIKLAGFVVPLEFDDDNVITEFFLVPFFGACIHVPPPPPNQIIYVKYKNGFKMDALYDPVWVYGVLSASLIENDMATSVYSLEMAKHATYKYAH